MVLFVKFNLIQKGKKYSKSKTLDACHLHIFDNFFTYFRNHKVWDNLCGIRIENSCSEVNSCCIRNIIYQEIWKKLKTVFESRTDTQTRYTHSSALRDERWSVAGRGPPSLACCSGGLLIPDRFLFVPSFTYKNLPEIKEIKLNKNDPTPHLYRIFSNSFLLWRLQ